MTLNLPPTGNRRHRAFVLSAGATPERRTCLLHLADSAHAGNDVAQTCTHDGLVRRASTCMTLNHVARKRTRQCLIFLVFLRISFCFSSPTLLEAEKTRVARATERRKKYVARRFRLTPRLTHTHRHACACVGSHSLMPPFFSPSNKNNINHDNDLVRDVNNVVNESERKHCTRSLPVSSFRCSIKCGHPCYGYATTFSP